MATCKKMTEKAWVSYLNTKVSGYPNGMPYKKNPETGFFNRPTTGVVKFSLTDGVKTIKGEFRLDYDSNFLPMYIQEKDVEQYKKFTNLTLFQLMTEFPDEILTNDLIIQKSFSGKKCLPTSEDQKDEEGQGWVNPTPDPVPDPEFFLDATLWHDAAESIWDGSKMSTIFRLTILNAPVNYEIKITGWFDYNNIINFSPSLPNFNSSLSGSSMFSISSIQSYRTDSQGHFELAFGPVDWTPKDLNKQTTLSLFLEFNVSSATNRAGSTSNRAYYIPPR